MPNTKLMYAVGYGPKEKYHDRFYSYESFSRSMTYPCLTARGETNCALVSRLKELWYNFSGTFEGVHNSGINADWRNDADYYDSGALKCLKRLYLQFKDLVERSKQPTYYPETLKDKLTATYVFIILAHKYFYAHYVVNLPALPKSLKSDYITAIRAINTQINRFSDSGV